MHLHTVSKMENVCWSSQFAMALRLLEFVFRSTCINTFTLCSYLHLLKLWNNENRGKCQTDDVDYTCVHDLQSIWTFVNCGSTPLYVWNKWVSVYVRIFIIDNFDKPKCLHKRLQDNQIECKIYTFLSIVILLFGFSIRKSNKSGKWVPIGFYFKCLIHFDLDRIH